MFDSLTALGSDSSHVVKVLGMAGPPLWDACLCGSSRSAQLEAETTQSLLDYLQLSYSADEHFLSSLMIAVKFNNLLIYRLWWQSRGCTMMRGRTRIIHASGWLRYARAAP